MGGVGVCFAGGSGGGALTNVYTGLIIHTDSPPPSYTYTNYTATTHLYTLYTSDPGLLATVKYQKPGREATKLSGKGLPIRHGQSTAKGSMLHSKQVAWVDRGYQIILVRAHSEYSPTREVPTADCFKTHYAFKSRQNKYNFNCK